MDFDLQMAAAKLAEALLPDDEVRQHKANTAVVSKDGGVHSRALAASLPWYRAGVFIPGAATSASDVARMPFAQGGTIRHVSIHARTAPSGTYIIRLTSGAESERFSMQGGVTTTMRGASLRVEPGSWVIVDILNDGGAADVEITTLYAVSPGGSTSGGTGGGGGGAASWGSIGGTLAHQSDLWIALAGKADDDHNHDGDYSPATHSHAYSELTDRPALGTAAAMDANSFATAAQGAQAESAVQPDDLADVATSGDYNDLDNTPTIPAQFSPIAGANMSITGTYPNMTFNASGGGGGAVGWDDVTDKPTEFPPSSHSHSWGQVTGKPSTFPPSTHSHDERYYTQAEVDAIVAAAQPEIHSQREQTNLTTPITSTNASANYGQGTTARTTSLGALIPAISDGVWDVDVEASATLYRDVSTGGMIIYIGDAVSSFGNALVRGGIDSASGITLTAYACFKGITHTTTIDLRFSGFMTAGTTNCISHGWKITARRANS